MVDEVSGVESGGPVLELELRFRVGEGEVDLSLISSSQRVVIFGPSGGGKSTLVRTLAGVERRARGRVAVQGKVWMDTARGISLPPWDRGVGWVPQDHLLFPHLDVRENLAYGRMGSAGVEEVARSLFVDHLLDRRPRRLSGGEQQRVALGRALLRDPDVLLLDEPFSALDRPLRGRVGEAIRRFSQEREIPILLVTHDEADAAALAKEHWLLSQGRLERVA